MILKDGLFGRKGCLFAILCFFAVLLCAGQSGSASAAGFGACDVTKSLGFCYEYVGEDYTQEKAKAECGGAPGGVYVEGECPKGDLIGTCEFDPKGNAGMRIVYYFSKSAFSPKAAKMSCPGTFTPAN